MNKPDSIVDDHLLWRNRTKKKKRQPNTYYVSDATDPCRRSAYYGLHGRSPLDLKALRIFNAGNVLEDWWVETLDSNPSYEVVDTQVAARYDFPVEDETVHIHGRLDALVQYEKKRLEGHEVKTIKNIYYVEKQGEAKEGHRVQNGFYLHQLGLKHGTIDYIDKHSFLQGEDKIDYMYQLSRHDIKYGFKKTVTEITSLHKHRRDEMLPAKNVCWKCNGENRDQKIYCGWYPRCMENYNPSEDDGRHLKEFLEENSVTGGS